MIINEYIFEILKYLIYNYILLLLKRNVNINIKKINNKVNNINTML